MILNLECYQAPLPYPELHGVTADKQLATALMAGYSGETSELTTVLQYGYHSLRCSRKYSEVAEMMRGIFYVETLHMELLGSCVQKLGLNPCYSLLVREKEIYWQSSLVDYGKSAKEMLLADIEGEKQAVAFYETTAAAVKQPAVASLLFRLAEDEKLHVRMLTDLCQRTF